MNTCKCHRLPPVIICYAVWLYYPSNLSRREIENLLAERGLRQFKSRKQAHHFLGVYATVSNLFGRHLVSPGYYQNLREDAFAKWCKVVV